MASNDKFSWNTQALRIAEKEEPRFLSILLRDSKYLADAIGSGISNKYFWCPDNIFLFSLMVKNFAKYGTSLTRSAMDSIVEQQETYTDEQRAARRKYWDEVYHNSERHIEDYEMLKTSICGRHAQEQLYSMVHGNLDKIVGMTSGQVDFIRDFQTQISDIKGLDFDSYARTLSMMDGMEEAMDFINKRRENPELDQGIKCGINAIDDVLYGFGGGSYTVITGMTGGGKTTLMFNMGFNMARAGKNVIYVTLEKQAQSLMVRLLSLHALTDYNRIKQGGKEKYGLNEYWFERLKKAKVDLVENIKPNFHAVQREPNTKLSAILSDVDNVRVKEKAKGNIIDVLIVDYLGVIGFETNHPTRPDLDLAHVSRKLQAYGKRTNMATITAIQLKAASVKEIRKQAKKATEEGGSGEDTIEVHSEDIAGSQEIIRDADNSLGVIKNDDKPATKVYVFFTKARDNEDYRVVQLDFDGKIGRIADPELETGQIGSVDAMIYQPEMTVDKLSEFFDSMEDGVDDNQEYEFDPTNAPDIPEETIFTSTPLDLDDETPIKPPKEKEKEELEIDDDGDLMIDLKF